MKIIEIVQDPYIDRIIDKHVSHEEIMGFVTLIIVLGEQMETK